MKALIEPSFALPTVMPLGWPGLIFEFDVESLT